MKSVEEMSIEEIEFHLAGLEDEVEEYHKLVEDLEFCRGLGYALEEGFIEAVEEEGELHFYCVAEPAYLS